MLRSHWDELNHFEAKAQKAQIVGLPTSGKGVNYRGEIEIGHRCLCAFETALVDWFKVVLLFSYPSFILSKLMA